MSLKIVYAGTPDFAVPALQALIDSPHDVVAVYTQPDRAAGRGQKLQQSPVKQLALAHKLPVVQPQNFRDEQSTATLRSLNADLMIVAAYGLLLPQSVLEIPPLGCINLHASLLPRWRGAAPIQYALLNGDDKTGITIMQMVKELDAGDILAQVSTRISPTETSQSLHDRLATMAASMLTGVLTLLEAGQVTPIPQDKALVTYAGKINKADAKLDWSLPAVDILRKIRAFYGWPVAFAELDHKRLRVWDAALCDLPSAFAPGTLVIEEKQLKVACGVGGLALLKVQLPGGTIITASDFVNSQCEKLKKVKMQLT